MPNFIPRQIQRYIPKQTQVAAQDINDIVERIKRLESLTVGAPLQLVSNARSIALGMNPNFFDSVESWAFVQVKTSFIDSDGPPGTSTPLEGYRYFQNSDGTYTASAEVIKFYNLIGIFGEAGDTAFLIKFPGKFHDWLLVFVRQVLYRLVDLIDPLDGTDQMSVVWEDFDDNTIAGLARNIFQFNAPANALGYIARFGNQWRIIQTTNPCP